MSNLDILIFKVKDNYYAIDSVHVYEAIDNLDHLPVAGNTNTCVTGMVKCSGQNVHMYRSSQNLI